MALQRIDLLSEAVQQVFQVQGQAGGGVGEARQGGEVGGVLDGIREAFLFSVR